MLELGHFVSLYGHGGIYALVADVATLIVNRSYTFLSNDFLNGDVLRISVRSSQLVLVVLSEALPNAPVVSIELADRPCHLESLGRALALLVL